MRATVSKKLALKVCEVIALEHSHKNYFMRVQMVPHEMGWGIDLYVDRQKWEQAGMIGKSPPNYLRVPVCTLLCG